MLLLLLLRYYTKGKQWEKIQYGNERIPLSDYIFAKEIKLGHYRGQNPPGAEVAAKNMIIDPMSRPPHKWRVPYVIVSIIYICSIYLLYMCYISIQIRLNLSVKC